MEETKCERERQTTATVKVRRDATTNDERVTRWMKFASFQFHLVSRDRDDDHASAVR